MLNGGKMTKSDEERLKLIRFEAKNSLPSVYPKYNVNFLLDLVGSLKMDNELQKNKIWEQRDREKKTRDKIKFLETILEKVEEVDLQKLIEFVFNYDTQARCLYGERKKLEDLKQAIADYKKEK